jgi:hypothetical protein
MATENQLLFAVEIEVQTAYCAAPLNSLERTAYMLSKYLKRRGIPSHVNKDLDESIETYQVWTIMPEVTIDGNPKQNQCKPCEVTFRTIHSTNAK